MKSFIFKNRGEILLIITVINIFFSIFVVADQYLEGNFYWLINAVINITVIIFTIYLYFKLNDSEYSLAKEQFLQANLQICYVMLDRASHKLVLSPNAAKLLALSNQNEYSLVDLQTLFEEKDWQEIGNLLAHEQDFRSIDKIGTVTIHNNDFSKLFMRYHVHFISSSSLNLEGVIFWFADFTESIKTQFELISLIKHYRLTSYEMDFLFNNLPFPIWRREANDEIVFFNKAYINLDKAIDTQSNKHRSLIQIINQLTAQNKNRKHIIKDKKHFIVDNHYMAYEFTEIALGAHVGCVGFALDIRDKENLEKNSQSLQSIIDNILDYCTSALIIIDSKKKINEYNQKFIQMFGLDNEWLATKPLYLELLDKLRELKKIPEVKDFKDYKELQLRLLQEMTSPQTRFLHLANGKVLKCSIIPTKSGNTIVMYEDTTEIVNTERIYNELQSVYHVTLNSLNVPVANFSANGRIRYYNQKLASLLQITEDDLISLPHFKVIFDKSTLDSQEKELLKSEIISALESRKNKTFSFLGYDVNIKAMPDTSALLIFNPR